MTSILGINQCCSDTRNIDDLICVRDISVRCNSHTIQIQILIKYILASTKSISRIKVEYNINTSIAFGWCKFSACGNAASIVYNGISGQLSIMNEKQQIICQRNDPKYDISNVFEVNREDIRQVSNLLDQTSIQNKEVSLHVMAKVGNKRQMCALKLHTLWSPLKKDGYIGTVGDFDTVK